MKRLPPELWVFVAGLAGGQIMALPLGPGFRVSLLDVSTFILVGIAAWHVRRRMVPGLWGPVLAFAGAALLSLLVNFSRYPLYATGIGLAYVLRYVLYAALYWVAASGLYDGNRMPRALAYSGILIAVFGAVQLMLYPDLRNLYYLGWDPHSNRLFSTLLDPNYAALLFVFTILASMTGWRGKYSAIWIGVTVLSAGALILTYSRSGIAALTVALLVRGFVTGRKRLTVAIILAVFAAMLLVPHTGEGRNLLRTASVFARFDTFRSAVAVYRSHPVFGAGMQAVVSSGSSARGIPSRTGAGIDSSILFSAAAAGTAGVAAILWMFASFIRLGMAGAAKEKMREHAASYIAGVAAIAVHSLAVNSLFYPWVMAWLFSMTGYLEYRIRAGR